MEQVSEAKKKSDLGPRVISAIVYGVLVIVCMLLSKWTALLFISASAGMCAFELFRMLRADAKLPNELIGICTAVCYPISVVFFGLHGMLAIALLSFLALAGWFVFFPRARMQDVAVSFFGSCYCGMSLGCLMALRVAVPGFWGGVFALGIMCCVWAEDVFAYLVGRKIGKHKMAPKISPKKSWEGFIAGIVATMLMWYALSFIPGVGITALESIGLGIVCGCAAVLGDLFESRIKRGAGFKDSGNIMPGHGGILDRTDSLIMVSMVAAVALGLFRSVPIIM